MSRAVTLIAVVVVGLTFLFGFGNVWILGLRLGVPPYVAPLVAPAVDLSVAGLLIALRALALAGADEAAARPARRLLMFASAVTLALNIAEPMLAGLWARAAFDAVGPLLLIGWSHVGPDLLRAMVTDDQAETADAPPSSAPPKGRSDGATAAGGTDRLAALRARADEADRAHWRARGRPISAATLRDELGVASETARALVRELRSAKVPPSEQPATGGASSAGAGPTSVDQDGVRHLPAAARAS